jgi:hypothetical protein
MSDFIRSIKSRFQEQATFTVMAGLLILIIIGFTVYASIFLLSELNRSLAIPTESSEVQKFDIKGFEKLNLVK